jgi:hypothetical protein
MWEDPIVTEVRKVREQLARQFAFDVHAIFADLRKRQTLLGSRLVRRQRRAKAERAAPPDRDSAALHPGR